MKIVWSWLLELCDLDRVPTVEEGARALTRGGLEIEGMTDLGAGFRGVVVAEVGGKQPHPKSDKLTIAAARERIATALEQRVLEEIDARPTGDDAPLPLPPPEYIAPQGDTPPYPAQGKCPMHKTDWRLVPSGISKRTGKRYDAFWACSTAGCDQRPPR